MALLAEIEATRQATRAKVKREALRQLSQYVAKRVGQLDYPAFRAAGFDLGSGPTEPYCKVLTARLKGGGKRWNTPHADALMALAAVEHSRLWATYWQQQLRVA